MDAENSSCSLNPLPSSDKQTTFPSLPCSDVTTWLVPANGSGVNGCVTLPDPAREIPCSFYVFPFLPTECWWQWGPGEAEGMWWYNSGFLNDDRPPQLVILCVQNRVLFELQYNPTTIAIKNMVTRLLVFFFSFLFLRAASVAHGRSQARGLIGATAADLHHSYSCSTPRSELHVWPTLQLEAMLDP